MEQNKNSMELASKERRDKATAAAKQRVEIEHTDLLIKLRALMVFTKDERFLKLTTHARELLLEQYRVMARYAAILEERLSIM